MYWFGMARNRQCEKKLNDFWNGLLKKKKRNAHGFIFIDTNHLKSTSKYSNQCLFYLTMIYVEM